MRHHSEMRFPSQLLYQECNCHLCINTLLRVTVY